MTDTTTQLSFDPSGFDTFLAGRDEPEWHQVLRRQAFEQFEQMQWPSQRNEEWMRTDIRLFKLDRFSPVSALNSPPDDPATGDDLSPMLAQGVDLAGEVHSLNGHTVSTRLKQKWSDKGVLFGSLRQMLQDHGDLVRPHLYRAFDSSYDRFAALHGAFWSCGTLLYVPRGVTVDEPLICSARTTDGGTDFNHTLVVLEDGAEATLLSESNNREDEAALHCGGIELIVGPRAYLRFVNLQDWGQKTWHFAHQSAVVDRDASLQWTIAALGSRLAKVNQSVNLVAPGANCQVNGVLFTEGKQHLAYHTTQHHQAPDGRSDFLYKAALQDQSRTVWRGMIRVDKVAQKTDGYQRNDNLLLSSRARADSIPGLEINADDVRCTHGSTSGRVDDELIFYAQCRGFTRREAIRAIVSGFFQQIFDRVTIDSVRETLSLAIARRVREYE